jgi:hypothetical protein
MQRTKYYVLPSHNGWEGMMEGAIRASVVARNKDEVLERTIELARKREPSASKILSIFW